MIVLSSLVTIVYAGPAVLRAARDGRAALLDARDAILRQDAEAARNDFTRARDVFRTADLRLGSPLVWPAGAVPVLGTHIRVGRSLAQIGSRVSEAGIAATQALSAFPGSELRLQQGRVDLNAVQRASDEFSVGVTAAADVEQIIDKIPTGWVVSSLARARREAIAQLPRGIEAIQKGQAALDALPSILGQGKTKRYVVAFSNLAELRGAGGFIGFVTVLRAENGRISLEGVSGRPADLFPPPAELGLSFPDWFSPNFRTQSGIFPNINLTSDFPTVGGLIVRTASAGIGPVDGVIGVDPIGLGAVLATTGPTTIPTWPAAITADNVSRIAQHDVYVQIQDRERREDFFAQLVRATFDRLVSTNVRIGPRSVGTFDRAVRGGHFRLFSKDRADQTAFVELGLAGGVDRAEGATDVLSVVSENDAGNKADWYLSRDIRYRVRLDPEDGSALTDLDVRFSNGAPASGLPDDVIGSFVPGLPRGTDRQIVMLIRSPMDKLTEFKIGTEDKTVQRSLEGSLRAHVSRMDIPASSTVELKASSIIGDAFFGSGRNRTYLLRVMPQAVANPDTFSIQIGAPSGWRVVGMSKFAGKLTEDLVLEVRIERSLPRWIWDKGFAEPWRLVRELLDRVF